MAEGENRSGSGIAHEFRETRRLYPTVAVDSEAVTVNLCLASVDDDVRSTSDR